MLTMVMAVDKTGDDNGFYKSGGDENNEKLAIVVSIEENHVDSCFIEPV